jgi:hypothetical protein
MEYSGKRAASWHDRKLQIVCGIFGIGAAHSAVAGFLYI